MKIAENMTALVGNTPLVKLNRVTEGCYATVVAKCEYFNPCASVKDRAGLAMIEMAEKQGLLNLCSKRFLCCFGNNFPYHRHKRKSKKRGNQESQTVAL